MPEVTFLWNDVTFTWTVKFRDPSTAFANTVLGIIALARSDGVRSFADLHSATGVLGTKNSTVIAEAMRALLEAINFNPSAKPASSAKSFGLLKCFVMRVEPLPERVPLELPALELALSALRQAALDGRMRPAIAGNPFWLQDAERELASLVSHK